MGSGVRACWGKKVLCALSKQRFPYLCCGVCVYCCWSILGSKGVAAYGNKDVEAGWTALVE